MNAIGIVAEYNPFHLGHLYHINKSKELVGENVGVVCVMSGDFVQRGEAAMYSKYARAEAAVRCGADLVAELPVPWALSSAEGFAAGGVAILEALGVKYLSFAGECGDIAPLNKAAEALCDDKTNEKIKALMKSRPTLSYPSAREIVMTQVSGVDREILSRPNDILGIEYLKAIKKYNMNITPLTIKRTGCGHDTLSDGDIKSAGELRSMLRRGESIERYIPAGAERVYKIEREAGRELRDMHNLETAVISRLRMFDEEYYNSLPDGADGLGMRLSKAAREFGILEEIYTAVKTKRYTLSRIRRMAMCAAVGIKRGDSEGLPPYIRILAANEKGRELLKKAKAEASLPIIIKPASIKDQSLRAQDVFALGVSANDLFSLGYSNRICSKGGQDWRNGPKIV